MPPLGLYIHIPFCVKKCWYCDFASQADKFELIHQYVEALGRELAFYDKRGLFRRYTPVTAYVGGGTPSLLSNELARIAAAYRELLHWDALTEKSLEVNPGAVTDEQLCRLYDAGFNRVSIGAQSFGDDELRALGRIHTPDHALACFYQAREAGFRNISLDFMFGIPDSTLDRWEMSLRRAIDLGPEHISMYNLTIEPGTPFGELQRQGRLRLPDEDTQLAMYEHGIQRLTEAGYEHYEISNFARPGYRCRHNEIYWRNEDYLGLGAAAHSYVQPRRYWNTPDVVAYIVGSVEDVAEEARYPATVSGEEALELPARMGETIMMNLRLREGVNLAAFETRFGVRLESRYAEVIERLMATDLVELTDSHLRLRPRGLYLSNSVFQEFIFDENT